MDVKKALCQCDLQMRKLLEENSINYTVKEKLNFQRFSKTQLSYCLSYVFNHLEMCYMVVRNVSVTTGFVP